MHQRPRSVDFIKKQTTRTEARPVINIAIVRSASLCKLLRILLKVMHMSLSARLHPHHRVFAAFAIYAFGLGQIFPRLPDIKFAMGIEEGALGLALMGIAVGTITALTLSTALVAKVGHRIAVLALIPAMVLFFAIAAFATGPLGFFVLLIPAGLCVGAIEIIINVEADRVEAGMDRRIMSRAHAFWSLGFFGAGVYSAVMVKFGITPQTQLMASLPVCILLMWLFLQTFQPAVIRATDHHDKSPIVARPTFAIMVLVGVTLSSMLLEGASIDWTAIYMDSVFVTIPEMGAIGVATAALSQGMVRYFGDRFVDRFAPVRVARGMQAIMALGVITVFFAPDPITALVGFAMIGAGNAMMFPLAMSAAAQRTDRPAAINVAALAQFSFVTFLLAPPILGFIAEQFGLRWTFGIGLPLIMLSFALSGALGAKPAKNTKQAVTG